MDERVTSMVDSAFEKGTMDFTGETSLERKEVEEQTVEKQQAIEVRYSGLIRADTKLNAKCICCKRCGSKIVRESVAVLIYDRKISMPSMHKKHEGTNTVEESSAFWLLRSPMEFENVGFTRAVDGIKYLCCADCEVGPVGLNVIEKGDELLVAADRVDYR